MRLSTESFPFLSTRKSGEVGVMQERGWIGWDELLVICDTQTFSCVQLFATPWIAANPVLWSMGFSRPEYWSGLPCPPPGYLLDPRIEPVSTACPSLAGEFFISSIINVSI